MIEEYRKKVLSGFAWEASSKIFIQVLSWASTIIVARLLLPSDYGIVLISGIFTGLLTMIASLGISSGVVYRDSVSHKELSTVFWLSILVGLFFYFLLFMSSGLIATLYKSDELDLILKIAGLMIVLSSANIVPHAMMMRELNFRFAAIVDMLSKLILIVSTLYMAYNGYGYWSLITSTVASQLFIFVTYLLFMRERPTLTLQLSTVGDILKFGLTVLTSRVLMWWNNSSAAAIVSVLFDKVVSGHLQMAFTLATIPLTKIGEIFDKIAFPAIAAIKGDTEKARDVFLTMHRYLLMITCPMFVGIAVVASDIVVLFLGEKWLPIVIPLQIMCLSNIFRVSSQLIPRVLEGVGNAKASAKFQLAMALICPIGMLIGSPYQLTGIMVGWFLTLPLVYLYLFWLAQKSLNIDFAPYFSTVWPPLVGCGLIFLASVLVDLTAQMFPMGAVLGLKIGLSAAVYLSFYWFVCRDQLLSAYRSIRNG